MTSSRIQVKFTDDVSISSAVSVTKLNATTASTRTVTGQDTTWQAITDVRKEKIPGSTELKELVLVEKESSCPVKLVPSQLKYWYSVGRNWSQGSYYAQGIVEL